MAILDFDTARQFFASPPSLPMMVYPHHAAESVRLAPQVGLSADQVIAGYNSTMFLGSTAPVFFNGTALAADEFRFASNDSPLQIVALENIAEFRHGFDVAELVLRDGDRVRLHGQLIPFLKLCMECMREATGASSNRSVGVLNPTPDGGI